MHIESRLMFYLTGRNHGIGLYVLDIHCIRCEYDYLSGPIFFHLIHRDKIGDKFGNV
jgi:hypothetical protein